MKITEDYISLKKKHNKFFTLLQSSKIGDLVLDPFCGSCNVGRVCDVLERNFVGYDINNYLV